MKYENYLNIGNITTIINSIMLIVAGYIIGWLLSLGFNVPVSQAELGALLTSIVFAVFSYINAKKHNNFFNKEEDTIQIPVNLNDAQITAIENFIEYQTGEKIQLKQNNTEIEDVDPASEYELTDDGDEQ